MPAVVAPVITQVSVVVLLVAGLATAMFFVQPATRFSEILPGQVIDGAAQLVTVTCFDAEAVPQLSVIV
jgi:hypothetical protein